MWKIIRLNLVIEFLSRESWSKPHLEEIVELDWREDYNPRYVEVAFSSNAVISNVVIVGPPYSSTWMNEIKQHEYPTSDSFNSLDGLRAENKMPIPYKDKNPYVEAFFGGGGLIYIVIYIHLELRVENQC